MREKIVACVCVLLFLFTCFPVVESYQSNNIRVDELVTATADLPDLVYNYIGCIDIDGEGHYVVEFSISNIGNAVAEEWSVNMSVHYFGALFLSKLGFDPFNNIFHQKISNFLFAFFHFETIFILSSCITSGLHNNLLPGETKEFTSWFEITMPINQFRTNGNIAIVIEGIADPEMDVEESNEQNNQEIVRWWFPLKNDPPTP